jgi:hypothetical protein
MPASKQADVTLAHWRARVLDHCGPSNGRLRRDDPIVDILTFLTAAMYLPVAGLRKIPDVPR